MEVLYSSDVQMWWIRMFLSLHRFVLAHIAGICRREILLEHFGEDLLSSCDTETCCDVCDTKMMGESRDIQQQMGVVLKGTHSLGNKGEGIDMWLIASMRTHLPCSYHYSTSRLLSL